MSVEEQIKQKLSSQLNIELLEVINESAFHQGPASAETHFRVLVVSLDFEGLSTVQRHQKVYQILKEELSGPIHAFSQKTLTPKEWQEGPVLSPSPPCQNKKSQSD